MSAEKRVAVLGSGRFGSLVAKDLGRALANSGYTVVTGGYDGVMASASEGAHEVAGAETIGIVLAAKPNGNEFLTKIEVCGEGLPIAEQYGIRLGKLLACDALVFFAGDIGALAELAAALNIKTKTCSGQPIFLALDPILQNNIEPSRQALGEEIFNANVIVCDRISTILDALDAREAREKHL